MIGSIAIGVAAVSFASASLDQASAGREQDKSGAIFVAVPTGRVSVGHEAVDGEPVYVRRTEAGAGMTIVEVSTTPFMPALESTDKPSAVTILRATPASQPAPW